MLSAIVFSKDLTSKCVCRLQSAHRLLRKGYARIIKFYPFTLQLKGSLPFKDLDEEDIVDVPFKPNNNPPVLTKRCQLHELVEVSHE